MSKIVKVARLLIVLGIAVYPMVGTAYADIRQETLGRL